MSPLRTGARTLVDQLRIQGVNHLFCQPAPELASLLDALAGTAGIRTTFTRHPVAPAYMAAAYARLTGQPGVALVGGGAAVLQAAAGFHHARQGGIPVALVAVQRRTAPSAGSWIGPLVKWSGTADRADHLPELVSVAFQAATSAQPGPVAIALAEEMLEPAAAAGNGRCHQPVQPAPSDTQTASLRRLLGHAQRPVLIVGGARWARSAVENLRAFVEANLLPVACTPGSRDEFDNRHLHYVGDTTSPGCRVRIRDADLVLALGVDWPQEGLARGGETGGETPGGAGTADDPGGARQIVVHAHPAIESLQAGGADLAIHTGMPQLAARLAMMTPIEDPPWAKTPTDGHIALLAWQARPAMPENRSAPLLDPWTVLQDLRAAIPDDAIVCEGAGATAAWLRRFFPYPMQATQLSPSDGCLGYPVAAAVAAKIIAPEKTVVCVCGDGDFLAGAPELAAAAQNGTGVVFVVFNNGRYGTMRRPSGERQAGHSPGSHLHNPDFTAFVRAHGGWGARIAENRDFPSALAKALAHARTNRSAALIDLALDPDLLESCGY